MLYTYISDVVDYAMLCIIYLFIRNNSVSPINQLLVCLRFYATDGHQLSLGDFGGMDKSTVSRIVVRVSEAISGLYNQYIKFPNTAAEIEEKQIEFFEIARFPRGIAAVDGTHIRIQSPGRYFLNSK